MHRISIAYDQRLLDGRLDEFTVGKYLAENWCDKIKTLGWAG